MQQTVQISQTTDKMVLRGSKRKSQNRKRYPDVPVAQPQIAEPGVHNMDCRKKDQGCSEETACYPFVDGTYRCVCPHDRSEPTEDMKCPNRKTVDKHPKPIDNIFSKPIAHNGSHVDQGQNEGLGQIATDQSSPQGGYNFTQIMNRCQDQANSTSPQN
ncbi:uncharacterized protein LOC113379428 [Ctenocephalides felis]|uniref:uncharacterized protein LOC113379428 n=1 Tax=Ctenocephalides felis TaxID=7515 RepID=UPI000E6E1775|nr:uncharacterized protein LOC113379428 [Ctenocephalides felis]